MSTHTYHLTIVLAPLAAAIIAGLFGKQIGRAGAHWITILAVGLSFVLSSLVLRDLYWGGGQIENYSVYTWAVIDGLRMEVGFLVDRLTALMMVVVSFVSLMVHVYTIGYMHDDDGYQRFFSYISFFTFSMLMLVMSNNFLQLYFGWEAVPLCHFASKKAKCVVRSRLFAWWYRVVVDKSISVPTGRAMSAQGNALGTNVTTIRSPERAR